jgi:hypothetical protein
LVWFGWLLNVVIRVLFVLKVASGRNDHSMMTAPLTFCCLGDSHLAQLQRLAACLLNLAHKRTLQGILDWSTQYFLCYCGGY